MAARDSDNLQQAGGAGSGPDSRRVHRDGRDSIRRRSLSPDPKIGMTGAEAPWVRSVRTSHLWWRSVASTEVPAPRWTVIHPRQPRPESALLPSRDRRSAPGTPTGVTRTGSDSNVSMVTSKNVSEDPFLSVRTALPEPLRSCAPPVPTYALRENRGFVTALRESFFSRLICVDRVTVAFRFPQMGIGPHESSRLVTRSQRAPRFPHAHAESIRMARSRAPLPL